MEMNESPRNPAAREKVRAALNDPEMSVVVPREESTAKPGWVAKVAGTSAVVAVLAWSGANWCCVTGVHHHAPIMSGEICSHMRSVDRG